MRVILRCSARRVGGSGVRSVPDGEVGPLLGRGHLRGVTCVTAWGGGVSSHREWQVAECLQV